MAPVEQGNYSGRVSEQRSFTAVTPQRWNRRQANCDKEGDSLRSMGTQVCKERLWPVGDRSNPGQAPISDLGCLVRRPKDRRFRVEFLRIRRPVLKESKPHVRNG